MFNWSPASTVPTKTRDAELATYGINGFAGAKHDLGPESNLDGKQQVKHRLAATWTGSSFTFGYDLQNPRDAIAAAE